MTLGAFIKQYREQNNVTQDEFSKLAKISRGYISQLESGVNPKTGKPAEPSLVTLNSIAKAMKMSVDELLMNVDTFNLSLSAEMPNTRSEEIGRIASRLNENSQRALLVFARALENEQKQ